MPMIETRDGTEIYYKDWGAGQPVVFSHGWPLSADAFEDQMFFLASHGYRVIAHDRRGHGRSSQPWQGNDMDTYADDLAELMAKLDVKGAVHVGHSTGGGEVARYIARHGTSQVTKAVLIGAVPPLMLKTEANPGGLSMEVFDGIRANVLADRSKFWMDLSMAFYGYNKPGAVISEGVRESFWLQGMMVGLPASYFCIKAFSETDQTEDLKKIDVPTLILHGDADQIVPIGNSAMLSAKLVRKAELKVVPGAPHGMCTTHKGLINEARDHRETGGAGARRVFSPPFFDRGWGVKWILKLARVGDEGPSVDVIEFSKPDDLGDISNLGLTLAEAKQLLARVQCEISSAQASKHAIRRPVCPCRSGVCQVKDHRDHTVATLFGQVTMRLPRFRCGACGRIETGLSWPPYCRSTPELDRLRAHLSALMSYKMAADLLEQMFPVGAGTDPETLRRHTLKAGAALADRAAIRPPAVVAAITVTVDATFIRSREEDERHFEVRVGNVETKAGGRQVFGGVAKAGTDIEGLIRKNLDAVGGNRDTVLTAFTDGCPGLRGILAGAGVLESPILDWFHIAMKLQHLKQVADGLVAADPARAAAKAVIVAEVERLRWRIWNGKAKNARKSIDRIRPVMHHFRGERDGRQSIAPSRKLWTAIRALNKYLTGQSA